LKAYTAQQAPSLPSSMYLDYAYHLPQGLAEGVHIYGKRY
jgi:hypothetical protein